MFSLRSLVGVGLLPLALMGCGHTRKSENAERSDVVSAPIPYDLAQPAERHDLPADLREVSGLSYYKPGRLACVQDELAVVFIYDYPQRRVVDEHVFGQPGDYEGVEFVDGRLYVLRSDGEVYHFAPTDGVKTLGGSPEIRHIKIGLKGKNGSDQPDVEGLGYDPTLNALLLATKDVANSTDKPIYFYDLKNQALWRGPVLQQAALRALAGTDAVVKPAGIAVHPQTGNYYVLSAEGRRLVVTNRNGKLLSSVALDKALFNKPEGLCFAPDGTLFIASEGKKGASGYILTFGMQSVAP